MSSNETKVENLNSKYCSSCNVTRRTDLRIVNTPGDELGADIWKSQDIFGLSLNLLPCPKHKLCDDCLSDDVNITPIDVEDKPFNSNLQLESYDLESIEYQKSDNIIIQMIIQEVESLNGSYPFKKGTPDEVSYNYKLIVKYIPFVLNVFHFQIEVLSDESGEWKLISREITKKYIRALASKIRARLLDENKVRKLSA